MVLHTSKAIVEASIPFVSDVKCTRRPLLAQGSEDGSRVGTFLESHDVTSRGVTRILGDIQQTGSASRGSLSLSSEDSEGNETGESEHLWRGERRREKAVQKNTGEVLAAAPRLL